LFDKTELEQALSTGAASITEEPSRNQLLLFDF
jgi:hypothetical protein